MAITYPTFDELLNNILTDYRNQNGTVQTETFIRAACTASALWGAYKNQQRIEKNIFPDTSDSEALSHHYWTFIGKSPDASMTDADILASLLDYIRRPAAGGNKYDYPKWAKEIFGVGGAWAFPLAQGPGSVDVLVSADITLTGAELPSLSARMNFATSAATGKLIDGTANFTDVAKPVQIGDVVENTIDNTFTFVTAVDSATQLSLQDDIFHYAGENYVLHYHCGATTGNTANKLVDAGADFQNATWPAHQGDLVLNLTTGAQATVSAVDTSGQLSLSADIFTDAGQKYAVKSLLAQVQAHIDNVRPGGFKDCRILSPTITTKAVTIAITGNADKTKIAADIMDYLNTMEPGQTLYLNQLVTLAILEGATNAVVSVPAMDSAPGSYEMFRSGVITVN